MKGLFKVTFGSRRAGRNFASETVMAGDAIDAIRKATTKLGPRVMRLEGGLVAEEVELLGTES